MRRLVVPWTVFSPIRCRNFLPRVVEGAIARKNLHSDRMLGAALVKLLGQSRAETSCILRRSFVDDLIVKLGVW
jgi:hypothetical protein